MLSVAAILPTTLTPAPLLRDVPSSVALDVKYVTKSLVAVLDCSTALVLAAAEVVLLPLEATLNCTNRPGPKRRRSFATSTDASEKIGSLTIEISTSSTPAIAHRSAKDNCAFPAASLNESPDIFTATV